jgi:hypothetical protein
MHVACKARMRVIHLLPIVPMSIRTYAAQLIMVHSVARHLGNSDEQAQEAIQAAGHRLKRAGDPPHSVSLIYGWGEG